jgi:dipeptidyl aminopeptidase/acylaminoacyl peptidase
VVWSKDSKAFYVTRSDARNVANLWVINSLAAPRPTLETYPYPLPGEEGVRRTELYVLPVSTKKLTRVAPKWKDESYENTHWGKTGDDLRFFRRDRLVRNVEFCTINPRTGECRCLIEEGFENANLTSTTVRYLEDSDEMIWWSERSGWGHFYLYDRDGKLKNAITSGPYRAGRIVDVDEKNRTLYFLGNGREPSENVYYEHLYSVRFDGSGLTLLDPGDASHRSVLSPTRQYLVDNRSRVDQAPKSVLRDAGGKEIMVLEESDLSRLYEAGWKLPETFVVKAGDGITDLYGNLWKPFDFDPNKKYPIIANVYPGPQTEGVSHTFAPSGGTMQLAQLGFIVIQVGHRGGIPTRSKAYGSYGYFNLRDYGLADKKYAIEQLAARHAWIDIKRVGLYGHSGGGFMTAAALLQKPYNEFFKVGIATSGNHDNNIYGNYWAERYHGLKEVAVTDDKTKNGTRGERDASTATQQARRGASEGPDAWELLQTEAEQWLEEAAAAEELQSLLNPEWTPPPSMAGQFGGRAPAGDGLGAAETQDEIRVPTNQELAPNLRGKLLLIHGELDNNVHPANTLRLVDALIKANKRFDMMYLPGKRHGYGDYQPYVTQRMWQYFAEHLMGEDPRGADLYER